MMRICFITPEFPPFRIGGIGSYVSTLAANLGAQSHRVDVVGFDIHGSNSTMQHEWGQSISLGYQSSRLTRRLFRIIAAATVKKLPLAWRLNGLFSKVHGLLSAIILSNYINRHGSKYDIIEYPNWCGQAALFPDRFRSRYVVRLSTSIADTASPCPSLFDLERSSVAKASAVIAHTQAMLTKGKHLYDIAATSGKVIPLGLPSRPFVDRHDRSHQLTMVSLGRWELRKGSDLLLKALDRLVPEFPNLVFKSIGPFRSQFVNSDDDLKKIWNNLQDNYPNQVIDLGLLSDQEKENEIRNAHWLIAPSRFESFGLMILEAMRHGTPCIYSNHSGLSEVGSKASENIPVMADSLVDLMRGIREACSLGSSHALDVRRSVYDVFMNQFRDDILVDESLRVYDRVLASRSC